MKIRASNKEKARAWKQAHKDRSPAPALGTAMRMRYLAMFALPVYCVLATAYWIYGLAYERGLVGYLMYFDMVRIGSFSLKWVAIEAMVVLALPMLPLGYLRSFYSDRPGSVTQPAPDRPWRAFSLKIILGTGISIVFAAALICLVLAQIDRADQKRTVFEIDLDRSAELPADGTKFAQLRGVLRPDLEYQLSSSSSRYAYTPLVGSGWQPGQPVNYFHYRWIGSNTRSTQLPSTVPKRFEKTDSPSSSVFPVKLSQNALPTYVERSYSDKGMPLASPHYVVEDVEITPVGAAASQIDNIVAYGAGFGGALALIIMGVLGATNVGRARVLAATAGSALRVYVTADQIAHQKVIQVLLPGGGSLPIRLPRDAKQDDVFRPGGGDFASSTDLIVYLDVVDKQRLDELIYEWSKNA